MSCIKTVKNVSTSKIAIPKVIDPFSNYVLHNIGVDYCLFEFMLNVSVNSYGHVGTLPPFYGTFTQN